MNSLYKNGIYVDSLTGLNNFFKLIESDLEEVFGKEGSTLVLDVKGFSRINERYGRETGDVCLKSLSEIMLETVKEEENCNIYRTGGDEFFIIFKEAPLEKVEEIARIIQNEFEKMMEKNQIENTGLHNFAFSYSKPLSFFGFLNTLFQKTWRAKDEQDSKNWVEQMILTLINRIRETITLFNGAYEMALTDDISELPNHRSASLFLEQLMKEVTQEKGPFSILFIDGDNLKRYNTISYQAGNEMIKDLSAVINDSLREGDQVFRWLSGDEFLVVLEKADQDEAFQVAEVIRRAVEQQTLQWHYPVTISIGVSTYPQDGEEVENLIIKAEQANSRAKSLGKNQVVRWSHQMAY